MTEIDGNGLKLLIETLIRNLSEHQRDEGNILIRLEDKLSGIKIDVEILKTQRGLAADAFAFRNKWAQALVVAAIAAGVALTVAWLK